MSNEVKGLPAEELRAHFKPELLSFDTTESLEHSRTGSWDRNCNRRHQIRMGMKESAIISSLRAVESGSHLHCERPL